ncbi:CamS family sex pheromone protein [Exiguobacterium sp. SL14]|nr:CamS family sex pheromone protein [Exiguobacterium sp. SL14]
MSANDWKNYNERYYYYPSARATNDVRDDAAKFDLFKDRLEDYFPNYTGMMGEGFYQEDELKKLEMKITGSILRESRARRIRSVRDVLA